MQTLYSWLRFESSPWCILCDKLTLRTSEAERHLHSRNDHGTGDEFGIHHYHHERIRTCNLPLLPYPLPNHTCARRGNSKILARLLRSAIPTLPSMSPPSMSERRKELYPGSKDIPVLGLHLRKDDAHSLLDQANEVASLLTVKTSPPDKKRHSDIRNTAYSRNQ